MATLTFYLVVAGTLALVGALALGIAHLVIVSAGGRAVQPAAAGAHPAVRRGSLTDLVVGDANAPSAARTSVGDSAGAFALLATALLGGSLIVRAILVARGPWGNLYEFSVAFAFSIVAASIALDRRGRYRPLASIAHALALGLLLYAATLPNEIVALVPALQHPLLLTIHVGLAMLSYGIFAFAFAAGCAYLMQGAGDRYDWLPSAKRLDEIAFRAVTIGFPLFAGMLILGSIWASIAWSRYWGWDPKETWSFITWTVFAGYLHARTTSGWRGRRAAVIALVGFVSLLITYYAVNLWIVGLHS